MNNNKGLSLVELIVSLLILMIIAVPVITTYQTAISANRRTEDISSAETAASAVLEDIKYNGIDNLRKNATTNSGGWSYQPGDVGAGIPEYYRLTNTLYDDGYEEGTNSYDVRVYFDDSDYGVVGGANRYKYADLSGFASSESIVLNPAVVSMDFDDLATEFFIQQYDHYAEMENAQLWTDWRTRYNEVIAYNDENPDTPKDLPEKPVDFEAPSKYLSGAALDNFNSCITKSESAVLVPHRIDNGDGSYSSGMMMTSRMEYYFDNSKGLSYETGKPGQTYRFQCSTTKRVFSGFCENAVYLNVKSIYILYSPMSDNLVCDMVTIINGTAPQYEDGQISNWVSVYVVVQAPEDKEYETDVDGCITINIPSVTGVTNEDGTPLINYNDNLRVCSQARLKFNDLKPGDFSGGVGDYGTNAKSYRDRLVSEEDDYSDRICKVMVKILPQGCTAVPGSAEEDSACVARLDSTILQ